MAENLVYVHRNLGFLSRYQSSYRDIEETREVCHFHLENSELSSLVKGVELTWWRSEDQEDTCLSEDPWQDNAQRWRQMVEIDCLVDRQEKEFVYNNEGNWCCQFSVTWWLSH